MEQTEQQIEPAERMWAEARCALWENWPDLPDGDRQEVCTRRAEVVFHDVHSGGCRHWMLCKDHGNLMQLRIRNDELNHGHIEHARAIDRAFEPLRVGGCGGC